MNKIYLYIILTLVVQACVSDKKTEPADFFMSENSINVIVLIDNSKPKSETQIEREQLILKEIISHFEERQKEIYSFLSSKDKLSFHFLNSPVVDKANYTLSINMGENKMNYPHYKCIRDSIFYSINQHYAQPLKADRTVWHFFKTTLPTYIKPSNTGTKCLNKLIVISDGYLNGTNTGSINTSIQDEDLLRLRNKDKWENIFASSNIKLTPHKNSNFENLESILIELSPSKPIVNTNELDILCKYWKTWFNEMGIPLDIFESEKDLNKTSEEIKSFFNRIPEKYQMKIELSTKGQLYSCKQHKNPEIVKGLRGKYFIVNILDSDIKEQINFEPGKYYIQDFEKYAKGIAEFGINICSKLDNSDFSKTYKVFIKGNADFSGNDSFKAKLNDNYLYKNISYYKKFGNTDFLFIPECDIMKVNNYFTNNELPNLRAKFISEKYIELLPNFECTPTILDGSVTLKISETERNVIILLYLPESFYRKIQ